MKDKSELSENLSKNANIFAAALYSRLADKPGNVFFSPFSVYTCLSMAYAGARGETEKQMTAVLNSNTDIHKFHEMTRKLLEEILQDNPDYELVIADSIWHEINADVLKEYTNLLSKNYASQINPIGFIADPEASRKKINSWVENKTRDRIKDLVSKGSVTVDTRMLLVNAIYFKAPWETFFKSENTKETPFYISADKTVKAHMMNAVLSVNYFKGEGFKAVKIPYRAGELSMTVLLPDDRGRIGEIESQHLNKGKIHDLLDKIAGSKYEMVDLYLPRFKTEGAFLLKETLSDMGMLDAFKAQTADFTGMFTKRYIEENKGIFINDVVHRAFVETDEKGTEAAAATAIFLATGGGVPTGKIVFRADHPFVFMITHERTKTVLFMGRMANP